MLGGLFGSTTDDIFERYSVDFNQKYGEGGYGATFAALDTHTGERLACKLIDTRRMRRDAIEKECKILEVLTHPNIIAVKAHSLGKGKMKAHSHIYFIFMELASGGELFDQVIDRGAKAMDEPTARGFFNQIVDGVAYCHLAGVAHRDLKLENVLLNEKGVVKVIDFGLSHVYPKVADGSVDRSKPLHDVCGSKSYAAPEVLLGNKGKAPGYDGYAADVWSLGVCLFAMLSGFFPLDEATDTDWRFPRLVQAQNTGTVSTVKAVYAFYKRKTDHLTPEVIHLLDNLLAIDPRKRMTMDQLRSHPWVLQTKFGGAQPADQGSYNPAQQVSLDDGPAYRGMSGVAGDFEPAMMEEDEMPVYRSLGDLVDEEPPALPMLGKQKAFGVFLVENAPPL